MIEPNFFIIGAPKCGTTALCQYLSEHKNIFISNPKEPQYFDTDLKKHLNIQFEDYLALFKAADPLIHLAVGEGSTSYLYSVEAVPRILKFCPDAKFIVMIRNPVDLVQSYHSEMLFTAIEDIEDFGEAWKAEPLRRSGKKIPRGCCEPKRLLYSEWGRLGDQVQRLLKFVPRKKILVVVFEYFVTNTPQVYAEVLRFLEVPQDGRLHFPRVNESKKVIWPKIQVGLKYINNIAARIKKGLGIRGNWGYFNRALWLNSRAAQRKAISEKFRKKLKSYYVQDISKLSLLLKTDLSRWKS